MSWLGDQKARERTNERKGRRLDAPEDFHARLGVKLRAWLLVEKERERERESTTENEY